MVLFWITNWKIDDEELVFEKKVNPTWKVVLRNMWIGIR